MYTQFRELETALLAAKQVAIEINRNPAANLPTESSKRVFQIIWDIDSLNRQLDLIKDEIGSWDPVTRDDVQDYRHSRP